MGKYIIAGNWKMNKTPSEARALAAEIAKRYPSASCEVVLCVPFVDLFAIREAVSGTSVRIGAQNVHWAKSGAFTGEISADMLVECGVEYVVIGHSERRQYFGETDKTVNDRLTAALAAGLKVILCVGETEAHRDAGETETVVKNQVVRDLEGVGADAMKSVVIAYEPVWAIGTGRTATDDQAEEVCALIRGIISGIYGKESAEELTIQYGGSMNAKNAKGLLSMPNIDGGLIGGASLKPDDFGVIIEAAK
ncbi:MAG: triose-phosphate isomerase [Oscillospiraceae bacterium]|nr:triose-phosphate isomerase [Oscillospiraceae bacterium]